MSIRMLEVPVLRMRRSAVSVRKRDRLGRTCGVLLEIVGVMAVP